MAPSYIRALTSWKSAAFHRLPYPMHLSAKTKSPVVYRGYRCSLSLLQRMSHACKDLGCRRSLLREHNRDSHSRLFSAIAKNSYPQCIPAIRKYSLLKIGRRSLNVCAGSLGSLADSFRPQAVLPNPCSANPIFRGIGPP
jgi:hypothetical protein